MTQRLPGVLCVVLAFVVLGACGGGGGSTTPTPTVVSITVASSGSTLLLGITETFTATATLSNGSSQTVTGGTWGTDAPTVATVNATTGLVSSVSPGEVTIFVDSQGVRGSKRITVTQSYNGLWVGNYTVTSCSQTGDFAGPSINLCSVLTIGSTPGVAFSLTQTGSTVGGQTFLGSLPASAFFTTVAAPNGALSFQALFSQGTVRIAQAWQINMTPAGQLAGTVVQTWTDTGLTGQMVVGGTLLTVVRTDALPAPDRWPGAAPLSLADIAAAVRGR